MKKLLLFCLLAFISISKVSSQNCGINTDFPTSLSELEARNLLIAECYAPQILQIAENNDALLLSSGGLADLITRIDFDGDWNTTNNSEAIGPNADFSPRIYFSVVWLSDGWFITYAIYHPRDWSLSSDPCCDGGLGFPGDSHENDLEGGIIVVDYKNAQQPVIGALSLSHKNLMDYFQQSTVPTFTVDNRTHAVEILQPGQCMNYDGILPCDNCTDNSRVITYIHTNGNPSLSYQDVDGLFEGTGAYDLDDIFGSHTNSVANHKFNQNVFNGSNFVSNSEGCLANGSDANAPWGWPQMPYNNEFLEFLYCQSMFDHCEDFNMDLLFDGLYVRDNPYNRVFGCNLYAPLELEYSYGDYDYEYNVHPDFEVAKITVGRRTRLTINHKTINFTKNAQIILEEGAILEITNSVLQTCMYYGEKWQGIIAKGKGSTIRVYDTKIINANEGILLLQDPNYTGGYFTTKLKVNENTEFIRCNTAIKAFDTRRIQVGNGYGMVLIDDCEKGIDVTNCTDFSVSNTRFNLCNTGLLALNSSVNVNGGNEFLENHSGILYLNTSPMTDKHLKVGGVGFAPNYFRSTYNIGIYGGNGFISNQIINNTFAGGEIGIGCLVLGSTVINNNTFMDMERGIYQLSTGDEFSEANCNEFSNIQQYGIGYIGNNDKSEFLQNDFASVVDIDVIGDYWKLRDNIGSLNGSANNLFGTNTRFGFSDNTQGSFTYWYDIFDQNNRKKPEESSLYELDESILEGDHCQNNVVGIFNLIDPDGDGSIGLHPDSLPYGCCKGCIIDSIDHYLELVVELGGDDPTTIENENTDKLSDAGVAEEKLDQWIRCGGLIGALTDDSLYVESIFEDLEDFTYKKHLLGYYIAKGNLNAAESILNSVDSEDLNQSAFYATQELNLRCLDWKWNNHWTIDTTDITNMLAIANGTTTSAGLAGALYMWMSGETFIPNLDININQSTPRSAQNSEAFRSAPKKSILYPNPAEDVIFVESREENFLSFGLYSIDGRKVLEKYNLNQRQVNIEVDHVHEGIYFLIITYTDGSSEQHKVIIE